MTLDTAGQRVVTNCPAYRPARPPVQRSDLRKRRKARSDGKSPFGAVVAEDARHADDALSEGHCGTTGSVPRRALLALALAVLTAGCAGSDQPIRVDVREVAAELGCTELHVEPPHEQFTDGHARCRFAGDLVNIRAFQNNAMRDNWIAEVDQYVAHFCLNEGLLLYGERVETADAIRAVLGCRVLRHD